MDRLLVFHQIFDKELNVHGFLNHEFPFIFASLICIHIFISKNHPSLCCDLVKGRPSTGKPGWLRLWMIKYAWLANEVSATDNTPLCANLCKFLTDTLIKSRQSLTEIRACKHVIVCIVHTEATRTYKEWESINRNNKLIHTGDLPVSLLHGRRCFVFWINCVGCVGFLPSRYRHLSAVQYISNHYFSISTFGKVEATF